MSKYVVIDEKNNDYPIRIFSRLESARLWIFRQPCNSGLKIKIISDKERQNYLNDETKQWGTDD